MTRNQEVPVCGFCGQRHERHQDAFCGCGCGAEPAGCPDCLRAGGPTPRYDSEGARLPEVRLRPEMVDDVSDYDEEW